MTLRSKLASLETEKNRYLHPYRIAAEIVLDHGTHINAPNFVKIAESVGGYGEQVTDPGKLQDALKRGLEANQSGQPAIIDVSVA